MQKIRCGCGTEIPLSKGTPIEIFTEGAKRLLEFRCPDCKKSFTIEDPNDREYRNQKGNSDQ